MGYQALLFCPDEKTARTVTQVLSELEFTVAACTEPFAAVKKMMSDHFDALVVDCDNEQNATLLFKSARNSASNQTSLAVAVVEGQAGVAKAFRFGANLVLTKPINVEQAKGTLRVARGLLRKGEPGKPATTPAAAASASAAPAASPAQAKPAAASTPKPAAPRPAAPVAAKPGPSSLPPKPVPAGAPPVAKAPVPAQPVLSQPLMSQSHAGNSANENPLDAGVDHSAASPAAIPAAAKEHSAAPPRLTTWVPAASASAAAEAKAAPKLPTPPSFAGHAASAPAPALDPSPVVEAVPAAQESAKQDTILDKPAESAAGESHVSEGPTTTFTFGGAALQEESGSKKILLAVAAIALVAVGGYFGWNYYQSRASQKPAPVAVSHPAPPAQPVAAPAVSQSAATQPAPAPTTPATDSSTAAPNAQTPSSANAAAAPATNTTDSADSSDSDIPAPTPAPKKTASPAASSAKPAASKPSPAPLVVKGGQVSSLIAKPAANAGPDTPAPSAIGMAAPASNAPPLNLVGGNASAPKPMLEKLNISQGVSQGLLIKKVSPVYPKSALTMRMEGAVELVATISKTGDISSVKVVSGDGQLAKAATDAVKQWKYKPYLLNGEPVEIQTQVTINFRLPN